MKKIKLLTVGLLIFIFTMGLCGCGGKSPTDTVKSYLDEIKKGENGEFSKLVNNTLDTDNKDKENKDKENKDKTNKDKDKNNKDENESTKKLLNSMKQITYTINSEKIDGDSAKVNVKVKGPDIAAVMGEYMQKGIETALSQAFSGQEPSKEEQDKLYEKVFLESMNNVKYTERTGDISLTKTDGKWNIKDDGSLMKLLMNIDPSIFKEQSKPTSNGKIQEMTLNKPFTVNTEDGKYTITIEGVRTTEKRNEFSEKEVKKVVMIDYSYANESFGAKKGVDLYIDSNTFQVLDDEGNVLDTYPVSDENREPKNTPIGGKCKGTVTYGLTTDSKNLNLTFMRKNTKISKIKLPIK